MQGPSIESVLQKFFLTSSRADWQKVAMQETRGENPFGLLSWRGRDGLTFSPYYDRADVATLGFGTSAAPSASGHASEGSCENLPAVDAFDERTANTFALDHLSNGGDGILFNLQKAGTDLHVLLADIEWPFCTLAFDVNARSGITQTLPSFFERRKVDPGSVKGALFWESIPKKSSLQYCVQNCKQLHAYGLAIPAGSPAAEISTALIGGVNVINAFESDQADALRAISFSINADASLLETAAKIRVLRSLWMSVAHAYGHNDYKLEDLYIHARSVSVTDDRYGPHENMLKGTFAAIGAVLGGSDGLTLMTPDKPPLVSRWARNVSLILREEAFFDAVADPLAGSYAFDSITDAIAQEAWRLFQEKWRTL